MSTFSGKLEEKGFEYCRIDHFEDFEGATAFFLSHFHRDHMSGISSEKFGDKFKEENVFFYCSEITKRFIERDSDISIPISKIIILEKEEIYISHGNVAIKVTPMRAGHCPGSLMFLFESYGGRVLYTGDFRLSLKDLEKTSALHHEGRIIKLDNVYLDTTFASPIHTSFPERELSFSLIKEIIKRAKILSNINYTVFFPPAGVGIEYLMLELHESFKKFIHVSDYAYRRFHSNIQPLEKIVTTDITSTDIHFCTYNRSNCDTCPLEKDKYKVLKIKPTAFYFNEDVGTNNKWYLQEDILYYRVAYSSHASLNELNDFVNYLKPKTISPSVVSNYSREMIIDMVLNWRNDKMDDGC